MSLSPPFVKNDLFSAFVQDEIALIPDRLFLTVGTKLERNYYTGWAAMPSARVAWLINDQAHALGSLFQAHSNSLRDGRRAAFQCVGISGGPGGLPAVIEITGNPNYGNETLTAYENGLSHGLSGKTLD